MKPKKNLNQERIGIIKMEKNTIKIIQGDCLEELKKLENNSIDAIVTDPPYGLVSIVKRFGKEGSAPAKFGTDGAFSRVSKGFMGKEWDGSGIENNIEMWRECLRVLKPGAFLLSFAGTRTYHRIALAIEDAGFEIRDMIEWVYGCLSEDTEILTPYGWEHYNKTKHLNSSIPILIYDVKNNFYKWEKPKGWSEYSLNKDTCYRIKSDTTDQLVSRNHSCLVEREGKLIFVKAEELQEVEYMPILSDDFSILSERQRELLQSDMLWESKGLVEELFSKWFGQEKSKERTQNGKEPFLERGSNLLQEERQLWEIQNKICEMSRTIYRYGEKGWLCNGTPIDNGEKFEKEFIKERSDTSQRPQSREQQDRELNSIQEQQRPQNTRGFRITKSKVTEEEYTGIIFCPTISTGCFVARRNGKIFITGNSGFPKSLNIGKAVDKLQGNEREVVGVSEGKGYSSQQEKNKDHGFRPYEKGLPHEHADRTLTKGTSEWEGWGTALKPAHEPICMARKPLSEKTVAENCLKWGTGGINIDESRVGTDIITNNINDFSNQHGNKFGNGMPIKKLGESQVVGRFPANLIHDNSEEVRECFPETKGDNRTEKSTYDKGIWGNAKPVISNALYSDSGNASRFFKSIIYCAKASKSERNKGCEGLDDNFTTEQNKWTENDYRKGEGEKTVLPTKNNHPTVKPIKLMEYLIKLVSKEGAVILDPFLGSGTTLVACQNTNRKGIGIEREEDYIKIAEARLKSQQEKTSSNEDLIAK